MSFVATAPLSIAEPPDWAAYNELLQRHLSPAEEDGIRHARVNYSAMQNDPLYAEVLSLLEQQSLDELATNEQRLAFYINAYNILAIKMVVDHQPLQSIRDAGSWFSPVWKKPIGTLGGEAVNLDYIEHEVLRRMDEPRIHFAIVCASLSCPDLRGEAFTADPIDKQLDEQTREFLANPDKGLRLERGSVRVSRIFDWFSDDFEDSGGVGTFIRQHHQIPPDLPIRADLPYNWKLNGE
ncbi:MAG: DUF547 domain-containing protein [Pseudohongiellaceae bacterium]